MLRIFFSLAICISCVSLAYPQINKNSTNSTKESAPFPEARFQISMSLSDLLMTVPNIGFQYRFYERNALALCFNNYIFPGNNAVNVEFVSANSINLNHKLYVAEANKNNYVYLQHGPRLAWGIYNIDSVIYTPYVQNGNTFYTPSDEVLTETAYSYGYDITMGFEFYRDVYFMEVNFGISYRNSDNSLKPKVDEAEYYFQNQIDWLRPITFTGFKPVACFKMGLYVDEILKF